MWAYPSELDPASGWHEPSLKPRRVRSVEAPALRVTLARGPAAARATGLSKLLARRAAAGATSSVRCIGGYRRIATRFGAVETLEAILAGSVRRICIGSLIREAVFRLAGWLCVPLGQPPEVRAPAFSLGVSNLDGPSDPATAAAFRASERDRAEGCRDAVGAFDPASRTGSIVRSPQRRRK